MSRRSKLNYFAVMAFELAMLLFADCSTWAGPRQDGTAAFARDSYSVAPSKARLLAEYGNPEAQALLGFMYEYGRGVPQDYTAAVYWYSCAADQGHPTAQYLLGLMYEKGHGIVQSDTLAYQWLILAASRAPPSAKEYYMRVRNAVAAKLSSAQILQAQRWASQFSPVPRR